MTYPWRKHLFETETLPPIAFLAELREEVLKHSLKRMPKWKFRFAPDLIVQLQPKPTIMLSAAATARGSKPKLQHFEGVAVMSEGVTGEALKRLPKRPCPPWWQIKFELFVSDPEMDWTFRRTSGSWQYGADETQISTLVQRIVTTLRNGFLTASVPAEMLSHNCVICGRGTNRSRINGEMDRPGMCGHEHASGAVHHCCQSNRNT